MQFAVSIFRIEVIFHTKYGIFIPPANYISYIGQSPSSYICTRGKVRDSTLEFKGVHVT